MVDVVCTSTYLRLYKSRRGGQGDMGISEVKGVGRKGNTGAGDEVGKRLDRVGESYGKQPSSQR